MSWTCPCGASHPDEVEHCKCGYRWHLDRGNHPGARGYIRCKVCDEGELVPRKVYRLSGPAVVIGYIFLIPSVLGMVLCGIAFLGVISSSSGGAVILGGGFFAALGISCFIGGLVGWLLVMQKHVLRCSLCGALVNAEAAEGSGLARQITGLAVLAALAVVFFTIKAVQRTGIKPETPLERTAIVQATAPQITDADFRRECMASARRAYMQKTGTEAPNGLLEDYCECAITTAKETHSVAAAARACTERIILRPATEQPPAVTQAQEPAATPEPPPAPAP
jgi:hypothetical protein